MYLGGLGLIGDHVLISRDNFCLNIPKWTINGADAKNFDYTSHRIHAYRNLKKVIKKQLNT